MSYLKMSGIYKISCLGNGKNYVGSSVSIRGRWATHESNLTRGVHPNRHLQNAWNKYGGMSFIFSTIELCEKDKLIKREQFWIDALLAHHQDYGMNNSPTATTTIGFRHSEETKKRLSEIARLRDPEIAKRIGDKNRGMASPFKGLPGRKWTDAEKKAASIERTGRKSWNMGLPMPMEIRAKISASLLRDGHRQKIPPPIRERIKVLRASGMKYEQIARETGVSLAQSHRIATGTMRTRSSRAQKGIDNIYL